MSTEEKKDLMRKTVTEMLNEAHQSMIEKIETVFRSGCVDIDEWDINNMGLPKSITTAIVQREGEMWDNLSNNITHKTKVKKEIKNIKYFI